MIPKLVYNAPDAESVQDPVADAAFGLIDQQFSELLNSAVRVTFGRAVDGAKLENLNAYWCVHTFGAVANTDETVPHKLALIPRALINVELPLFTGAAPVVGIVTFGATPPTATEVTVRCNAASKLAAFILIP